MGGIHKTDLMSDVAFLVVGDRYSDKYKFAVQKRSNMTFLKLDGIPKIFEKWRSGSDIDVDEELQKAKLPVFEGCNICSTNINSDPDRKILIDLILSHGGQYTPELTKSVTQLISPAAEGRKYKFAKKWGIGIVDPTWVMMSIERGAVLAEEYFAVGLPKEKMGEGARLFHLGKIVTEKEGEPKTSKEGQTDQSLQIKRKSISTSAWGSIIGDISKDYVRKEVTENQVWEETRDKETTETATATATATTTETEAEGEGRKTKRESMNNELNGLLSGNSFSFFGFSSKQLKRLQNIVSSHKGVICDDTISKPDIIIINSQTPVDKYNELELPSRFPGTPIYTEWALERSLHKKKLCLDVWGEYIIHRNMPEFRNINISLSGYTGVELLHLERLIALVGATYKSIFVSTDDILISTPKSSKFKYALVWNVPVVNHLWLWGCATKGLVLGLDSREWVLDGKEKDARTIEKAPKKRAQSPEILPLARSDTETISDKEERTKSRRRTRRIVGRATVSATSSIVAKHSMAAPIIEPLEKPPPSSQVSYLDIETQDERNKLLEAFGESETANLTKTVVQEEMSPAVDLLRKRPRRSSRVI